MRILHTADMHLKAYGDERWEALEALVELGRKQGVGILVISGDLFDRETEAERLRPKIREILSNTGFKILVIPGNHDKNSFRSETWFGEDVVVLNSPHVPYECTDVSIWGMPFEPIAGESILHNLHVLGRRLMEGRKNILLYHGELLDAYFSREDFGDEGEERYMPVKLSYFNNLNIDCVLGGHFHSSLNLWKLEGGGYFVYPGSPVSISKRETGQRKVHIFEPGKPPKEYGLDTPHFEDVLVVLDPFQDKDPVETVKAHFRHLHRAAKAILIVRGFVDGSALGMSERAIAEEIRKIVSGRCAVEKYEFSDIQVILDDRLSQRFMEKLGETDHEEATKRELRNAALKAMMDARR